MGQSFSQFITDWALVEIDDVRLNDLLKENPALLFRRMWLYAQVGIPYFCNPPEMEEFLKYEKPRFDSFEWTAQASETPVEVSTGKIGYDMMCVTEICVDGRGGVRSWPYYEASYDHDTGVVTFPAGIEDGTEFSLDFYKDGAFDNDLGSTVLRILAKCVALAWYERNGANWLNMQPKITDKSFTVGSEANHTNAQTTRINAYRAGLNDEIRRFEENSEYKRLARRGVIQR